ncbi:MAG: tyrosine-protein phosphatase [Sphingomonadaceae bacterium]|nr:tyrosine-protein phosphatase [Sphingomonadaceae bacterium]
MTEARILPLEGIHNFRDYGGYEGLDGRKVRSGLLWRSAQHGEATDADLAEVQRLGLATVIDLRGTSERMANPCRRAPGFAAEVLHSPGETAGLALHVEAAEGALTREQARAAMMRLYEGIAHRDNFVPMLRTYFDALLRAPQPSLVHCVAGKDRTGFAVALAQHVLGVARDAIVADYLLTNVAGNIERRIEQGAETIRAKYGSIDEATIRTLMGVEEDYIVTALDRAEAAHGSLDSYLETVLGVDAAARERLRAHYLVD